ncbi:MAG: M23 family metallopeptidase [Deltaproteobacteria bacterium]|nr:M23 family metallopeptidase [Deltaproteobacteria bacterium]
MLSYNGFSTRHVTVSSPFLLFFCCIIAAFLILSGFFVYDYSILRKELIKKQTLESKVSFQQEKITLQHHQIQNLVNEINSFKSKLVELKKIKKKIRIISDFEDAEDDKANNLGMGGPIEEDLCPGVDIAEKHNSMMQKIHEHMEMLNLASTRQQEGFNSLLKSLEDKRNLLAATPSICPTKGWISSRFGYRKCPFTGRRRFHSGLDIAARKGTPIVAPADGKVTYAGKKGLLGNLVVIDHGYGMITRYAHLYKALKKKGDIIKRGEIIGLVGSTGRSTGPHLHYEVRLNGIPLNPANTYKNRS